MFTIVNEETGRKFNVKILRKGDRYGLNKCRLHEKDDPLVEFYDAQFKQDPEGSFISRYYADTLLGRSKLSRGDISLGKRGLCLDGYNADTRYLTPESCMCVGVWLHSELDYDN